MLTKDCFKKGIEELVAVFPNWEIDISDPNVLRKWYAQFKFLADGDFNKMIDTYIKVERFNPTVASLRGCIPRNKKTLLQEKHEKMMKENGLW